MEVARANAGSAHGALMAVLRSRQPCRDFPVRRIGGQHAAMFKAGTVFILGAAVSAEVGLPLGWGLKSKINDLLPTPSGGGDDYVRATLLNRFGVDEGMAAAAALARALPRAASIDNLVEHRGANNAFKSCAKIGIAAAILNGERTSRLYRGPSKPFGSIEAEDTTYADIFRLMVGNAGTNQLADAISRVSFINFNYDRCLEFFLIDWLVGYSGLEPKDAVRLVDGLKVVRPYGSLGTAGFGQELRRVDLGGVAENILTFSEERGSAVDLEVHEVMAKAEQLIFLGCAYHPQNLRLLRPEWCRFGYAYGTCYMPPPQDPLALSVPSLSEFATPTAMAFEHELRHWSRHPHDSLWNVVFQSLTAKQLVAKYAAEWIVR